MEILKVENLSKVYGAKENKVVALDNVSFSVNKGEFVAIVGHSGSGKSTLLHLIGGVDRPTKGKVIIEGNDIYTLNDDNLDVMIKGAGRTEWDDDGSDEGWLRRCGNEK